MPDESRPLDQQQPLELIPSHVYESRYEFVKKLAHKLWVNAGGSYSALQIPSALAGNKSDGTPANSFFNGGGFSASAAWNLDFWGLYRRQTEAARAELLASEWGQRATRVGR